jgi:hypothetical protein
LTTKDQVAELLAAGEGNRAQGLGLVALAVAHEAPDIAVLVVHEAAVRLVLHDPRLVDRLDRSEAHGHGGELPVVGHQPGVRVGGQPVAAYLATEPVQLFLRQAALEVRARIDARGAVALVEDQVAGVTIVGAAEEIVEADIIERGRGRKAGNMPAQPIVCCRWRA